MFLQKKADQKIEFPLDYDGTCLDPIKKSESSPRVKYKYNPEKGNINLFFQPESKADASPSMMSLPTGSKKDVKPEKAKKALFGTSFSMVRRSIV